MLQEDYLWFEEPGEGPIDEPDTKPGYHSSGLVNRGQRTGSQLFTMSQWGTMGLLHVPRHHQRCLLSCSAGTVLAAKAQSGIVRNTNSRKLAAAPVCQHSQAVGGRPDQHEE